MTKEFWKAALIRAIKTVCQTEMKMKVNLRKM